MSFNDFFQAPTADAIDLTHRLDTEVIPDLKSYTMGDLRALIRDSQTKQSFIGKNQIRTGSYPDKSVTPIKLSDDTWASIPRRLYTLQGNQSDVALGSTILANGAWQAWPSGWGMWRGASVLPAVDGFKREYSCCHQVYYNTSSVGTTAANWYFKLSANTNALIFNNYGGPYGTATDVSYIDPWQSIPGAVSAENLETLPDGHYYGMFLGNYVTSNFYIALRSFTIDGRYVRL